MLYGLTVRITATTWAGELTVRSCYSIQSKTKRSKVGLPSNADYTNAI